ncbi:phospholipid-transporting ATPase ABCA3-like [Gigantopelta aegis]|uniref:phospholipid-transporting ATPase ABCA3-like n=1 Tax=Gigantopelta aegis TaxID=1735272 RepID=UPI001B888282|nr:phospholipid-transporting ATPase ABCA3-like [Gigantopelta aegis]
MARTHHFLLLLWKNYLIQKRKIFLTFIEIFLPTFFAALLIVIRQVVKGTPITNVTTWDSCFIDTLPPVAPDSNLPHGLAFTPRNPAVLRIMSKMKDKLPAIHPDAGFDTEDEMVNFLLGNTTKYLGGIVFTSPFEKKGTAFSTKISVKIRLSSSPRNAGKQKQMNPFATDTRWKTKFMFPIFQRVGPREKKKKCGGAPGYYREGFLALQNAINYALFDEFSTAKTKYLINDTEMILQRHPYPPYNDDNFVLVIQKQFPMLLLLSFIVVALSIVKDVVHEKERKLKESMKMMGLSNWLHWTAWFVKYFLFLMVSVIIMTVFYSIKVGPKLENVIGKTAPTVLFVFLILYAISTIMFCFFISVFFSTANMAAAAGGILFFIFYIPYFFIQPRYDTMSWIFKIGASLDFQIAMALGGQVVGMFEGTGAGVQWDNVSKGASVDDDFALLHVFVMLLFDSFVYGLLAFYIEAVFPGEYGVPKPWYFPFKISYWCGTKSGDVYLDDQSVGQDPNLFEKDPVGLKAGIKIRNLRKEFRRNGEHKAAVAGMTLNMYEGQITALLGHNGAGKTTTMSMLTGFIPPTSGTALVNNYDIRTNIANVRQSLGLCPQHDVLFDTLTVEEHLIFFSKLKGVPKDKVSGEVENMLDCIGLTDKRNAQSKTLSGGMKRKLSVGIALIGDSKIIILDEPSSGMDPDARRHIWSVLQNNRAGRTMVLSTHFMDEADLLGDRIAIMTEGVIKCCGSSMFLKRKYGAGYHMVIVKSAVCDVNKITEVVKSYVPQAEVESNIGAELSYILPQESSNRFEELFTQLQNEQKQLGISSYGASVTTMEEVFLRVGENIDENLRKRLQKKTTEVEHFDMNGDTSPHVEIDLRTPVSHNWGTALYLQQFWAMFLKRVLHTFRNKVMTASQLIVPLFFTISALIVIKTLPETSTSPSLILTANDFKSNFLPYTTPVNASGNLKTLSSTYRDQFKSSMTKVVYVNDLPQFKTHPDVVKYLTEKGEESISTYNLRYVLAADFQQAGKKTKVVAYFNNQAYHSPAITLASMASAFIRFIANNSMVDFEMSNHPLPRSNASKLNDEMTQGFQGFMLAFNVCFGMAFLASSFAVFLVKERATKAKHIQFVSGVRAVNFWLSTFCWDFINYIIPAVLLIVCFAAFGTGQYVDDYRFFDILLLFVMYGWAMLPFMYLWSFLFQVSSTAYVWITMFNIISGVATLLTIGILSIPQLDLQYVAEILEWIFLTFLPNFCLAQGLQDFYQNNEFLNLCEPYIKFCPFMKKPFPCCRNNCGDLCADFNTDYLGWEANGIGRMLTFLTLQGFVYFSLVFLIESELLKTLFYKLRNWQNVHPLVIQRSDSRIQEDSDVATERARMANSTLWQLFGMDKLILQEVVKNYETICAVDHISVGIPQGECFGLLGINGAGKTTTFKMLTGDELMSNGEVYIDQCSVKTNIREVQRKLGYCPQFDALIGELTGREMLTMFARLRGVVEGKISHMVKNLINALLLTEHADKLSKTYSGGNKRKLSTAIALIGYPPIILLDEPTTGMDPVAKRLLWDALAAVRDSGKTLVLTSHSMEECEALCTRLAIMVNGQFKCLGSPQHLKNKFGEGYTLIVKVASTDVDPDPDLQPLMTFIEEQFAGSVLKDVHQSMLHYHITDVRLTWAQLFGIMERAKETYSIEDYLVGQTTLEQVFINFARSQVESNEIKKGCLSWCC